MLLPMDALATCCRADALAPAEAARAADAPKTVHHALPDRVWAQRFSELGKHMYQIISLDEE